LQWRLWVDAGCVWKNGGAAKLVRGDGIADGEARAAALGFAVSQVKLELQQSCDDDGLPE
jgi:hypothetical protein